MRAYANAASRNALEEFLALYHPQISKYRFPGELASQGIEHKRHLYERSFAQTPELRVEVVQLIAVGNKVAVHDRVTGLASGKTVNELTVYEVKDGRILNIVAVDVSAASITETQRRLAASGCDKVHPMQADIHDLALAEGSFDHVCVCFVLEHLPYPLRALAALKRMLRPGGTITVIEGDHGSALFHPDDADARAAIA